MDSLPLKAVAGLPTKQCAQLGQRIADQDYTYDEAFEVCLWLFDRQKGYVCIHPSRNMKGGCNICGDPAL